MMVNFNTGNLKDLRNRMSAAYIMINALWLVLNFALQLSITDVAIVFYIGSTKNTVSPAKSWKHKYRIFKIVNYNKYLFTK